MPVQPKKSACFFYIVSKTDTSFFHLLIYKFLYFLSFVDM